MSLLKRGRPIEAQAREIIYNVYEFMRKEAQEAKNVVFNKDRFQKVIERTSQAAGVSRKTITRILKESDSARSSSAGPSTGPFFKTPKKGRYKRTHHLNLDDFDYQAIRRKIYDFHLVKKQATMKALLDKLKKDMDFTGSTETLRRIVKELGFKFKKTESKSQFLVEKNEVRLQRIKYLRQVKRFRNEGREIVYIAKTYVKNPDSNGPRLIMVHAAGANGFVPNALLIYNKSTQNTGDYHSDINKETYDKWLQEKLIPNLRPNSVLIINNTFYRRMLEDKASNSYSTKRTMQEGLTSKNINFEAKALKPELYDMIKQHKQQTAKYTLDSIMEAHGHKVLRLPPYHPDFNPTESICSQVKDYISKQNVSMNMTELERLLKEKFSLIGQEECQEAINRAIKSEDEFLALEEVIDNRLDEFVIKPKDDSSAASSLDSANSDSDSSSNNGSDIEMESSINRGSVIKTESKADYGSFIKIESNTNNDRDIKTESNIFEGCDIKIEFMDPLE